VLESYVPDLIREQLRQLNITTESPLASIGTISLSTVNKGAGAVVQQLRHCLQQGNRWIVVDAASSHDITQVALAFARCQHDLELLPMGSAGFAHALADVWQQHKEPLQSSQTLGRETGSRIVTTGTPPSPITVISGSTTSVSQQQLERLVVAAQQKSWRYAMVHPEPQRWYQSSPPSMQTLPPSTDLSIITSCLSNEDKTTALELGERYGFSSKQVAKRIEQGLATVTEHTTPKHHALVLCGGATAQVVLQRLGIFKLCMKKRLLDNVALLQDELSQRLVVLKSGNMGDTSTLVELVYQLRDA
jgi:uncharacterized protein YgbK (DUF1537 family)